MSKKAGNVKEQIVNLPKNIQQMGRTDGGIKVYLEDYSATWLRRILGEESGRHGILLGKKQVDSKHTYFFVEAVLAVEAEKQDKGWKYNWNNIYELIQKYFVSDGTDKLEVLGWAMPIDEYKKLDMNELETMHRSNFEGNMTLAFTIDMQEGREQFYILENNRFHSLGGYYIYYEKNKAMQKYVLENQPGPCVETEECVKGNGESYRSILMKQKELVQKRYTVSILYAASTFLVMIVIVLGITMMNNYEKMQNMQVLINDLSASVVNEEIQPANIVSAPAVDNTIIAEETPVENAPAENVPIENVAETPYAEQNQFGNNEEIVQAMSSTVVQETVVDGSVRKRYEIQPGDTLEAISIRMYNTDQMVDKICQYNDIENGDQIVAGDMLILP